MRSVFRVSPAAVPFDPGVQYRRVRHAFGLDISDGSLKAAECSLPRGKVVLEAASRCDLPADVVVHGEVRKPDVLTDAIRECLRRAQPRPITTRHVLLSLGEANVYLHPFRFPGALTEAQVRRAAPFEAEGELPITLGETVTDMLFHRSRGEDHHVLFVAAPRALVDTYVRVLVAAGLSPLAFETESLALSRCLIGTQDAPVLLLDIGGSFATVTTVERGMVHGAVNIPVGGSHLTEALAAALKVAPDEAERVKRAAGLTGVPPEGRAALARALEPLLAEAMKAATYHQTHTGRPVGELLLSGGAALLKGIAPLFQERTGLPTSLGDPLAAHGIAFSSRVPEAQRTALAEERIVYADSIGLAIRGAGSEPVLGGLNLLPPVVRERYRAWREQVVMAAVSVLLAIVTGAAALSLGTWEGRLLLERQRLQAHVLTRESLYASAEVQQAIREATETNTELRTLRQFADERVDVGTLVAELSLRAPAAVRLASITVVRTPEGVPTVTVSGQAARREDFLAYESALRAVENVASLDSPLSNLDQPVETPFTLTVRLKQETGHREPETGNQLETRGVQP